MNRKMIKIKIGTGFVASAIMAMPLGGAVMAWGPTDRPTYTNESPASSATFNSITDNAGVGDERDFVRIVDAETGGTYSSKIDLEPNKEYQVYIYYHNNASETYNDAAHNYAGVAADVKLASSFPLELSAGQEGAVSGIISWTTLADRNNVQRVWDEAWVTAKQDMTLHYVTGSAHIWNGGDLNGTTLSTNLFSEEGIKLGYNELNGVLLGCDQYSGHVNYTISTKPVDTPVDPENPTPDPEPEPTTKLPETLPETGPAEVFLAVVLALLIVAGFFYWRKTHKAVKKATRKAKGRKKQ